MKILFTDLDGTLLNDEKEISPALKQGLDAMLANGHYLVLTSGRPLNSVLEVRNQLALTHPHVFVIAFNGALVYDCSHQQILKQESISFSDTRYLLDKAKEYGLHCHTYSDTHILSERDTKELSYYRTHIHLPAMIVNDITKVLTTPPYKLIAIHLHDKQKLLAFQSAITADTKERITSLFSSDNYLEIFSKHAGKGNAVSFLCDYLQIPLADSIAAGDAENDKSMLDAAGIAVAMANGSTSLKATADYVTKNSNNHDGLLESLLTYQLIS